MTDPLATTPAGQVDLYGQYYHRVSAGIHSRLSATALALESANGEQAVLVALDLAAFQTGFQEDLRARLRPELPELDVSRIFLNAIHTHNAPRVDPITGSGGLIINGEVGAAGGQKLVAITVAEIEALWK